MTLFPIHRPRLGLSFGPQTLSLVEVESSWRPGWGGARLRRWKDRPVPSGLIKVSATEPNVQDVKLLTDELRALRVSLENSEGKLEPVALSLPDLCARAALLEFDNLPTKPSEREALLRWQLRQKFQLPAVPSRLVYRTFPHRDQSGRAGNKIGVLAVTILDHVLAPYEQACAEAGLMPVIVGLNSLQLFDLCRPAMQTAGHERDESFFLALNEESFAFVAVRQRVPVLLRIKPWRAASPKGALTDELAATLQFYEDIFPSQPGQAPRPLFLMEATTAAGEHGLSPVLAESLGVHIIPIDRDGLPVIQSASAPANILPATGLPAVAGVMTL